MRPLSNLYAGYAGTPYAVGFGDAGFDEIAQNNPTFVSAWNTIQAQLIAEQAPAADVGAAKTAFTNAYNGILSNTAGDLGGQEVINAAQQFVMSSRTTLGAAQNIVGLLSTGTGAPPIQTAMSVMGTMIGTFATAAVAAGVVSAGVGAAIVAGIALVGEGLAALGLFGGNNPGASICGSTVNPPPGYVVGCVAVYGLIPTKAGPGSGAWRRFPDVNSPADNNWFNPEIENFDWAGANWTNVINPSRRPDWSSMIEAAFPEFYYLACEATSAPSGPVGDFQRAFFAAWKANKEYGINGLNPLADWQVLAHTAVLWNRAHEPGAGYDFTPGGNLADASNRRGGKYVQNITSCAGSAIPYARMLVDQIRYQSPVQNMIVNGNLHIHTGPAKVQQLHIRPGQIPGIPGPPSAGGSPPKSPPASSTTRDVALGVVGAAVGGFIISGVVAYLQHKTMGFVLDHAWEKTKKALHLKAPRRGARRLR